MASRNSICSSVRSYMSPILALARPPPAPRGLGGVAAFYPGARERLGVLGLRRAGLGARRVGDLAPLGEVALEDHERHAHQLTRGLADLARALGQTERADDEAPVVLHLEQARAARQPGVERLRVLVRGELDRVALGDDRRQREEAGGALGVALAHRLGPGGDQRAQALGVALR